MNLYLDVLMKYGALDIDLKKIITNNEYYNIFMLILTQMFRFPSLDYNTFMMCETLLNVKGCATLGLDKDDNICTGIPIFGEIDNNGLPILTDSITIKGEKMHDFILIRNNIFLTSEHMIIDRHAFQLMRIDFSEGKLVQKSVCNPIPIAKSQKAYNGIVESLKASGNDDIVVLQLDNSWGDTIEGRNDYDMIEFTDIAHADKFKYLSTYHNDILSRLFFLYGFALHSPTKQAQTNDTELDYRNECSSLYVNQRYSTRYEDYKKASEKLGINFDFKWSNLWKTSIEGYSSTNKGSEV